MEGQDKDSPVPLVHKAQASAAPSFWDCPVQSQELDLILVVLSSSGYSGIPMELPPGLLSPCSPRCSPAAAGIAAQGCLRSSVGTASSACSGEEPPAATQGKGMRQDWGCPS